MLISEPQDILEWPSSAGGRVLVIGDIHGEYEMLQRLLTYANYDEERDFVYALGDLVDRGPDSPGVLDWFASGPRRRSLLGNHEALMLDAERYWDTHFLWKSNGGHWAGSLSQRDLFLYRCMLRTFSLTAEIRYDDGYRVGLVHADVPPRTTWQQMAKVQLQGEDAVRHNLDTRPVTAIWGRSRFQSAMHVLKRSNFEMDMSWHKVFRWKRIQPIKGIDLVISGHNLIPDHTPFGLGNMMWIETGGPFNGRLTAIDPKAKTYWQVGKSADAVWGPLSLPEPMPLPRAWRPTKREFAISRAHEAEGAPLFKKRRIESDRRFD